MPNPSAAVLFVDMQEGLIEMAKTQPTADLRKGAGVLAEVAGALGMPVFASGIPAGPAGARPLIAELSKAAPGVVMSVRRSFSAFSDAEIETRLPPGTFDMLLLSGVATEAAVFSTALEALRRGFDVRIVVDACSGLSPRTEGVALRQIEAAGGVTTCIASVAAERAGDLGSPAGQAVMLALRRLL